MAIFYLQVEGVLPCLHKEKPDLFGKKSNYMNLQHVQLTNADKSPNHDESLSIGELFIKFLGYYVDKFDFNKEGISVRLGRTIRKPKSTPDRNHRIFIEDPFNQTNVAKAVKCDDSFKKIMHAFTQSLTRLEISDDLSEVVGQYMAWDIENDEWVNLD
ncbi:hypothetical protein SUGI_1502150 [Cryptomeria japonica]|uniref:PAP-associated domain-containing protein n=1 Tax=Cryptomeria japonica TaxID=3369 RepID=A0AAD3NVQ7_CRYJA|nr:hypothetical protein SUGI_1502150 [Cryptomeria japonica]